MSSDWGASPREYVLTQWVSNGSERRLKRIRTIRFVVRPSVRIIESRFDDRVTGVVMSDIPSTKSVAYDVLRRFLIEGNRGFAGIWDMSPGEFDDDDKRELGLMRMMHDL